MSRTKNVLTAVLLAALVVVGGISVQAQEADDDATTTTEQLREKIEALQEQVNELRAQLEARSENANEEQEETEEGEGEDESSGERPDHVPPTPNSPERATTTQAFACQRLQRGERSEAVRKLQEFLANSEEIYPEGLATGYYGRLTSQAVKRLQGRIGIPSDGESVGPKTFNKVQELIENGAGQSGVIPPGLLRAPGIQCRQRSSTSSSATSSEDESRATTSGLDVESLPIDADLKERLRGVLENVFGGGEGNGRGNSQRSSSAGQ